MAKNKVQHITVSDNLAPRHLLLLDAAVAEKTFNRLSLDQKVQLVLAAPWQKRRDIITLAENALQLVHALPCEELYWTVRQCGVQDSLQLISLTSHEQFQFLVDMDCWRKDSMDMPAIAQWYSVLSKCNELKVMQWFHEADEQFLVASLKKLVRVRKIQQDTDISEEYEDMPAATLDGIYFFIFLDKDSYSSVMPLFNSLYLNDRDMFYSIAEGIIWDTAPEVEEAAYCWKSRRLAEYGFPEFEEALNIYQLLSDAELQGLAASPADCDDRTEETRQHAIQPRYRLAGDDMPRFYREVLGMLDDVETCEGVQRETIILANKIIIADGLEVQSVEDAGRALSKAAGAISIALEFLSNSNPAAAFSMVTRIPAMTLFRAGITLIMKTRKDFLHMSWSIVDKALLASFCGTPYGEALSGLTHSRPLFYEGLTQPGATQYRAFMALEELLAVRKALSTCQELDRLLFGISAVDPVWLFSDFFATTTCDEPGDLSLDAVVMTMLGRLALGGTARLEALSEAEVIALIKKVIKKRPSGDFALCESFRDSARNWVATAYDGRTPQLIQEYLMQLLLHFEEAVSPLAGKKIIEKRYIDKLLFKRA